MQCEHAMMREVGELALACNRLRCCSINMQEIITTIANYKGT
jgi:hypothetical protein